MYEIIYNRFGITAIFQPLTGDSFPLLVIKKDEEIFQPPGAMNYAKTRFLLSYRRIDIDRRVKKGETFTIGETVYTVFSMGDYPDCWNKYRGECVVTL
jgi:hypothetical protein